MATEKDFQIFVAGVTQYSMSSGKFSADDITGIAQAAYDAFQAVFGPPERQAAPVPQRAPAISQAAPGAPIGIPPETKPFNVWGGDKAFYGKNDEMLYGQPIREVQWTTFVSMAMQGDEQARKILQIMANGKVGSNPQYAKYDAAKIARAKACLQMLKGPAFQPVAPPEPSDPTPF